jgi:hypothetical protein
VHWVHSPKESPTEWSLRTLLLAFREVKGNHSGKNLAKVVMKILQEAGLTSKVCMVATYGAFKLIKLDWLDYVGQRYHQRQDDGTP